jgi:hypothetical protein
MDFRKKLLVLSASAMAFAGMASAASIPCPTAANNTGLPNILRVEGTNDLVTDFNVSCAAGATLTSGTVVVNLTGTVTSQVFGHSTTSEATLNFYATAGGALISSYPGTILGTQVTFGSVVFPTVAYTIKVQNVRVNSSVLTTGVYVTETLLVYNDGVVAFSSGPENVGYVQQGFAVPTVTGIAGPYAICQGNTDVSFTVNLAERFGGAFKSQAPTTQTATQGEEFCNTGATCTSTNGEQGTYPANPTVGGIGSATSGTRFVLVFTGLVTGETLYLPVSVAGTSDDFGGDGLTMNLTSSATGAFSAVAAAGGHAPVGYAAITPTNGTATAVYEVVQTDNTIPTETVAIPGIIAFAANFASAPPASPSVTVTPAPTGVTTAPDFTTSSNTAITLNAFTSCTTSLLFPFVTNQLGFDTGIVLANTSTDPFGVAGASPAPGTCTLNFYGAGAPTPSAVAAPGGSQASGTTNAFQLSSVAPGFQGYVIAVCNYQYGHGYAFIEYNLTQNNGVAEGYLALVIEDRGPASPETLSSARPGRLK